MIPSHTIALAAALPTIGAAWGDLLSAFGSVAAALRPAHDARYDDANAVRRMADSYRASEPGFAAELYAIADRHERQGAAID